MRNPVHTCTILCTCAILRNADVRKFGDGHFRSTLTDSMEELPSVELDVYVLHVIHMYMYIQYN